MSSPVSHVWRVLAVRAEELSPLPDRGLARSVTGTVVGTAIAASGFWLSLLVLGSSVPLGLIVIALSVTTAMIALAYFSGVPGPFGQGLRGASVGLAAGTALFGLAAVTGVGTLILLLPAVTLGIGGAIAYPASGGSRQIAWRLIAAGVAGIFIVVSGVVFLGVWAFLAPLLPLAAMRLADHLVESSAP